MLHPPGRLRVTVNRQSGEPFIKLQEGDETGLAPTCPATPDLI